jgi:predicted ATP-grasp superfamily ATP-dependent carboligase
VIDSPEAWSRFNPGESTNRWIVQPWIEAEALSLSALFNDGQACLLSVNRQRVTRQGGRLKLEGCEVNALPDHDQRYATLVNRIAGAIPGLQGYVGIDLLKTNDSLKLLEINPRLTTSYAGLRPSLAINPAEWVVRVMPGDAWPASPPLPLNPIDLHWHHP